MQYFGMHGKDPQLNSAVEALLVVAFASTDLRTQQLCLARRGHDVSFSSFAVLELFCLYSV